MKSYFSVITVCLMLAACVSTKYMPSGDLNINPSYFRTLKEPSLYEIAQKNSDAELYRLTVLSGITPIHSLRVKTQADESGTIIVKVANKGTRIQGKNTIRRRKSRKVSVQEISDLRDSFSKLNFQEIYPDQIFNEDEIWTDVTLLCYESVLNGKYHIVCDSTGNVTKLTHTLLPQFYRLGDVNSESDWSLFEYFGLDEID